MAKVELANGNCEGARAFIRNAFERAIPYPAMIVAIEAVTITSCPTLGTKNATTLETIAGANPYPDPLFYLYLLIGLIGCDKVDEGQRACPKTARERSEWHRIGDNRAAPTRSR